MSGSPRNCARLPTPIPRGASFPSWKVATASREESCPHSAGVSPHTFASCSARTTNSGTLRLPRRSKSLTCDRGGSRRRPGSPLHLRLYGHEKQLLYSLLLRLLLRRAKEEEAVAAAAVSAAAVADAGPSKRRRTAVDYSALNAQLEKESNGNANADAPMDGADVAGDVDEEHEEDEDADEEQGVDTDEEGEEADEDEEEDDDAGVLEMDE